MCALILGSTASSLAVNLHSHLSLSSSSVKMKIGLINIISTIMDYCKIQRDYVHSLTHNVYCVLNRHIYVHIQTYIVITMYKIFQSLLET